MTKFQFLVLFFLQVHCSDKKNKLTNKEIYTNLKKSLESIKKSCGDICDQTIKGEPGPYFDHIKKSVNCEALFSNPEIGKEHALKKYEQFILNTSCFCTMYNFHNFGLIFVGQCTVCLKG